MDRPADISSSLARLLAERYRLNAGTDLFDEGAVGGFSRTPREWAQSAYRGRPELGSAISAPDARTLLAGALRRDTARAIGRYNQFAHLDGSEAARLRRIYEEAIERAEPLLFYPCSFSRFERELTGLFADHFLALRDFLGGIRDAPLLRFGRVVCREYGPALQLEVLRVHPTDLLEPVLDLGCGERAGLVRALREMGVEAFGVDRFAPESRWTRRADWLGPPLQPRRWGTILSHMSFSNHFAHHHLRANGRFEAYAAKYAEALAALVPGGSFIYAPGLPFVEDVLPADMYEVRRFNLPPGWAGGAAAWAGDRCYTAHVKARLQGHHPVHRPVHRSPR